MGYPHPPSRRYVTRERPLICFYEYCLLQSGVNINVSLVFSCFDFHFEYVFFYFIRGTSQNFASFTLLIG